MIADRSEYFGGTDVNVPYRKANLVTEPAIVMSASVENAKCIFGIQLFGETVSRVKGQSAFFVSEDNSLPAALRIESLTNLRYLREAYNSPTGVVPFIGAGISIPFDFPGWGGCLIKRAKQIGKETKVRKLIFQGYYEEAASCLAEGNHRNAFHQQLEFMFRDEILDGKDLLSGAASLIPLLSSGTVITTNLDHVLERVFEAHGRPFKNVFLAGQAGLAWEAFVQNSPTLLKLHGDIDRRQVHSRILTLEEYREHYETRTGLPNLLRHIYSARPVVFIGCSLNGDRTVRELQKVALNSYTEHFAIVPASEDEAEQRNRHEYLTSHRIRPIWYPLGQHDLIEQHLLSVVKERFLFRKLFGSERDDMAIVHGHLTMAPSLREYIEHDQTFFSETQRNSIKTHFLVPANFGGEPEEKTSSGYKSRGTKVVCVCEVRGAAYLSAAFARLDLTSTIHTPHQFTKNRSCISLGAHSNAISRELLRTNSLVGLEGLEIDGPGNPKFVLKLRGGEPLHPPRPGANDAKVDYGVIIRVRSAEGSSPRLFVCAGLGEFGTSGAAWYLAHKWQSIAEEISSNTSAFACVLRVVNERDSSAEAIKMLEQTGDEKTISVTAYPKPSAAR